MRKLLPLKAFYYSNGPWRNCWVRLGYDPKDDMAALQYQVLELRAFFNKDLRASMHSGTESSEAKGKSHILRDGINPLTISHLFQLCDIQDEDIQRKVRQATPTGHRNADLFNGKTGWMSAATKESIVERIKTKWAAALQQIKTWRSSSDFPVSFNRPAKGAFTKGAIAHRAALKEGEEMRGHEDEDMRGHPPVEDSDDGSFDEYPLLESDDYSD